MLKPREKDIQAAILATLRAMRILCWRINTTGVPIHGPDGIVGMRPGPNRGVSDIIGCQRVTGRFIAIEVKRPGGKATPEQQEFLDSVTRAGGIAFVATSVDDVLNHPDLRRRQ